MSRRELKAALAELPDVSFAELRADADAASDDSLEAEERHLDALFDNAADPARHAR